MSTKPDLFRIRAEKTVTRVGQALLAGNREAAIKVVENGLKGHKPYTEQQFETLVTAPTGVTVEQELWQAAERLYGPEAGEYKWRSQVGRLVKACGKDRALEVLLDGERSAVIDPKAFIGAAIKQGKNPPAWKLDEGALLKEAGRLGVPTYGRSEEQIRRGIEKARRLDHTGEEDCNLGARLLG